MHIPCYIETIADKLQKKGHLIYIVGGAIRDHLLHKQANDYDLATSALPEDVENIFHKTIATGKRFGTITIISEKHHTEITTMRKESGYQDVRHPDQITFSKNINTDLKRRDFTMNSIAYDPYRKIYIDPFSGKSDIKNKTIRIVGNPASRISEDSLRIFRAARFAAQLNFNIDPESNSAIKSIAPTIDMPAYERIIIELKKTFNSNYYEKGLKYLFEWNILQTIFNVKSFSEIQALLCPQDDFLQKTAKLLSLSQINQEENLNKLRLSKKEIITIKKLIKNKFDYSLANITSKTIKIKGKELLEMGFKNKKIGIIQKQLVDQVKSGKIPNKNKSLRQYVKEHYSGNSLKSFKTF